MRMVRRFEVAERSMSPALEPGDYLVAVAGLPIRPGDLVVFEHPRRPGFLLVKRAARVEDGRVTVLSDRPDLTLADSRTFGPVSQRGMYRVVFRYWPWRRFGPVGSGRGW
jgi:phage repressor protein C with HTH and peptisase S24 domain